MTPWIVDYQAPPSTLDFPSKSTGVGCHFLLQRIFQTQGSNLGLPHWRQTLYRLSHQGGPVKFKPVLFRGPCAGALSQVRLFVIPWTVAFQAPLSTGFSRQEYWSGLPVPSPGDLPDPGITPTSVSPALASGFLLLVPPGNPLFRGQLYFFFLFCY